MKRVILILTMSLATPAMAQEDEGRGLMERGAQLFFEGLMSEMRPALDDLRGMAEEIEPQLRDFAREMGPAFAELMRDIKDFSNYEAPEILPNGDIIIRRKRPELTDPYNEVAPGGEIEI